MSDFSPSPTLTPDRSDSPGANTLGLAGFVTSLIGFVVTGGLLCPIGLLLSLIALRRAPRGFAIAGVVIGVLGSCGGCLMLLVVVPMLILILASGVTLAAALGFIAAGGPSALETFTHMVAVNQAISRFVEVRGVAPASLSELNVDPAQLIDGWGTPLQYQVSDASGKICWTLQSAGPDRMLDADDMTFSECQARTP
jgi:hypothetical protein